MATLSGLSSPFQSAGSSNRVNTAQLFNNNGRANFRVKSWLEQYLKQQEEAAAEKKAAEEEAAEQAAFEAQKQAHKDNADFVYEPEACYGTVKVHELEGAGQDQNIYVDMSGVSAEYDWTIHTESGDDVIYMGSNDKLPAITSAPLSDSKGNGFAYWDNVFSGAGDDKIFGGDGSQMAFGDVGDDLIDLGDGFDAAGGGYGSDEFIINLQNSGVDLVRDFIDVGDKITIYNGDELAEAGDWMLVSVGSEWTGPAFDNSNFAGVYETGHNFYELQTADGVSAAIFAAGTCILGGNSVGVEYQGPSSELTIQQSSSGLEVIEQNYSSSASVEFV